MVLLLRVLLLVVLLSALAPAHGLAQCLLMGGYQSYPPVSFSCAFGEIEWQVVDWLFEDLGYGQIGVIAYPGPLPYMVGELNCDTMTFEVFGEVFGGCLQGYMLSGYVLAPGTWTGTFTAGFAGMCYDCVNQDWGVSGSLGTGLPETSQNRTWGTIKALYR